MKIPRYWAYTKNDDIPSSNKISVVYWRSSGISAADAQAQADEAARNVEEYFANNCETFLESYPYGVTLREKLLEEINDSAGSPHAFLSRNHLGAVVLNVSSVMFLDWDIKPMSAWESLIWLAKKLFPFIKNDDTRYEFLTSDTMMPDYVPPVFRNIKELKPMVRFFQQHTDWSVRIYATAAGYRGLVTHRTFEPESDEVDELMKVICCDSLYRMLCRKQETFRARLTPKGSRLGLWGVPRVLPYEFRFKYPWLPEDTAAADLYDKAVQIYEDRSKDFATCRYLGTLGAECIHPHITPIVELHDRWTLDDGKPLA